MNTFGKYLLGRLREPSTWAGLSVIATLVGVPPGTFDLVHTIVIAGLGLAATVTPDRSASIVTESP